MTETDENTTDDVTDEATEEDTETGDQVAKARKDRKARREQLKKELDDIDAVDDDTVDGDVAEVTDAVEDEAEDIADGPANTDEQIESEAEDAAGEIATAAQRQGVTFSDQEIDGIAKRIVKRTKEIEAEEKDGETDSNSDEKPAKPARERRTPDRRPRGTHFSEKRLWGKARD